MGHGELLISHLFFADDSILFREATIDEVTSVKAIVDEHEALSGQLVNFDKTFIYFSKNTQEEVKQQLGGILGLRIVNNLEKYLTLPTMVCRRRKKGAFLELKEK